MYFGQRDSKAGLKKSSCSKRQPLPYLKRKTAKGGSKKGGIDFFEL
jgi:hypothetical protein